MSNPQAIIFYFPRWLWKQYEGGLLERLVNGSPEASATYFCRNSSRNGRYMSMYLISELVAFVNLISKTVYVKIRIEDSLRNCC